MADEDIPVGAPSVGVIITAFSVWFTYTGQIQYSIVLLGMMVVLALGFYYIWYNR